MERVLLRVCFLLREVEASGAEGAPRFWGTTTATVVGGVGVREMRTLDESAEAGFVGADVDVEARGVGEREGVDEDEAGGRGRVDRGDGLGEGTSGRDVDGAGLGEGTLRAERERREVLGERVFLFTPSIPLSNKKGEHAYLDSARSRERKERYSFSSRVGCSVK